MDAGAVDAVDAVDCAGGLLGLRARGLPRLDGRFWSLFGFAEFDGQKKPVRE